jgi:hypothetical protein
MKKQTLAIIVLLAAATATITSCQKSLDNPTADASVSLESRGPVERAWFDTFANNFGFVPILTVVGRHPTRHPPGTPAKAQAALPI